MDAPLNAPHSPLNSNKENFDSKIILYLIQDDLMQLTCFLQLCSLWKHTPPIFIFPWRVCYLQHLDVQSPHKMWCLCIKYLPPIALPFRPRHKTQNQAAHCLQPEPQCQKCLLLSLHLQARGSITSLSKSGIAKVKMQTYPDTSGETGDYFGKT